MLGQLNFRLPDVVFQVVGAQPGQHRALRHQLAAFYRHLVNHAANFKLHFNFGAGFNLAGSADSIHQRIKFGFNNFNVGVVGDGFRFGGGKIQITAHAAANHGGQNE